MPESPDLDRLAERVGHAFDDTELLRSALAHRSWCAEHGNRPSNERLEFLGDAVLGVVVTDHLYLSYPSLSEGELAKLRAGVVSAPALAQAARSIELGSELLLGKGEDATGGRDKTSILADAMEAVIGAVYLDGGVEPARRLVLGLLGERIADAAAGPGGDDHKTLLQELAARRFEELPLYLVSDEGPDHEKRFTARVHLQGAEMGVGIGRSKKQAEQEAARAAFGQLADEADTPRPAVSAAPAEGNDG